MHRLRPASRSLSCALALAVSAAAVTARAQVSERVVADPAGGEVFLAGRLSEFGDPAAPSRWSVITDLAEFRGRLFAASCYTYDAPGGSPYSKTAQVLEYDDAGGEWKVVHEVDGGAFLNLRVVGDRLLIPDFHPASDHARRVHSFNGATWGTLGPLPPGQIHGLDVLRFGGRLYASAAWRAPEPGAKEKDPHWIEGYGRIYASDDDGVTWTESWASAENGRVLDLVELNGRLYANDRGERLLGWDGRQWTGIPVRLPGQGAVQPKLGNAHLVAFAGRIVAMHAALCYTFDGAAWTSQTPGLLDAWVDGDVMYGLREDGHVYATRDASSWTRVTLLGVPKEEFDRTMGGGKRPLQRGAIAMHRGRLFVGTSAKGRIYASPFERRGRYESAPLGIPPSGGALEWESRTPGDATLRVCVRTASTREGLAAAAWREVEGRPPQPLGAAAGDRWWQFVADLTSDGRRTPVLRGVRVSAGEPGRGGPSSPGGLAPQVGHEERGKPPR